MIKQQERKAIVKRGRKTGNENTAGNQSGHAYRQTYFAYTVSQ